MRIFNQKFQDFISEVDTHFRVHQPQLIAKNIYPPPIASISCGLIIFHATWSGASIAIGKAMLSKIPIIQNSTIKIYVLNLDYLDNNYIRTILGGKLAHGYAEAAWIEQGKVLDHYQKSNDLMPFIEFVVDRITKI